MFTHGVVGEQFHLLGLAPQGQKFLDFLHFFYTVIDTANHRDPDPDICACVQQFFEVFQNQCIVCAHICFVLFRIHDFNVVQKKIRIGQNFLKGSKGNVPCGIHGGVDAVFFAFFEDLCQKIHLQHTFTAGEGHTAAGIIIKGFVFEDLR